MSGANSYALPNLHQQVQAFRDWVAYPGQPMDRDLLLWHLDGILTDSDEATA